MRYCVIRDGLKLFTLCRGNPFFNESFDEKKQKWMSEDLGGIYNGDITASFITSDIAHRIVKGELTAEQVYKNKEYYK